jgi:hypothetical protein
MQYAVCSMGLAVAVVVKLEISSFIEDIEFVFNKGGTILRRELLYSSLRYHRTVIK